MFLRLPTHRAVNALRCALLPNCIHIRFLAYKASAPDNDTHDETRSTHLNTGNPGNTAETGRATNDDKISGARNYGDPGNACAARDAIENHEAGNKTDFSTQPASLSQMIYKFFRKESQILSKTLDIEGKISTPPVDTDELPAHIKTQVDAQMDNYNKFLVLLSHHPLAVPPAVLLEYFSTLAKVDPADKSLLLRHLVFHHKWNELWHIAAEEDITLNDMEDLVEQIHCCLVENDDLLAVWGALESARKAPFSSAKLYTLLAETVQYKLGIDLQTLNQFHEGLDRLDGAEYVFLHVQDFEKILATFEDTTLKAHFFPRVLKQGSTNAQSSDFDLIDSCIRAIRASPGILQVRGFISHLGNPALIPHVMKRLPHSNHKDVHFLMQGLTPENAYQLYVVLCRSSPEKNEYIVNELAMRLHALLAVSVLMQLLRKFDVKAEVLCAVFSVVAGETHGMAILRRIFRKDSQKFGTALGSALPSLSKSALPELIQIVNEQNSGRPMVRAMIAHIKDPLVFSQILALDLSEYNTTEVWRCGVAEKFLDSENTGPLFSKMLQKAWRTADLEKRGVVSASARVEGFQEQYRHASTAEKHRLLVRIQAIAEAVSKADETYITSILNNIHSFIFPESVQISTTTKDRNSFFANDTAGKQYVFLHLIKQTAHFIYKSSIDPQTGLLKLSNILRHVQFKALDLHASVYEHMVIGNPQIALHILPIYENRGLDRKLMNGIEQGILKTKLSRKDKLELFQEFQQKKSESFGNKLATRTVVLLGKVFFSSADVDPTLSKTFIEMAYDSKVPVRVIREWTRLIR